MDCLILARSLTYAQRTERALIGSGIRAKVVRLPSELSEGGCGYAVRLRAEDTAAAEELLKARGLPPRGIRCDLPR